MALVSLRHRDDLQVAAVFMCHLCNGKADTGAKSGSVGAAGARGCAQNMGD
jgi:hypothetical protein